MRRLASAALVEEERPRGHMHLGRRVVNPKAVYGSQRSHARALYRRINGPPAPPATPGALPPTFGAADDPIREPVNWGMVIALLGCLAFWGAVVLGLVVAV
jgi:hypothetical protein